MSPFSWTIPAETENKSDFISFDSAESVQSRRKKKKETGQSRVSNDLGKRVKSSTGIDHSGSQHSVSPLLFKLPCVKKACRFPWRPVTSEVWRDTPDSASSSDSSPSASLPLCFTAATGITAPKSFFPAAALSCGKTGNQIPKDFWVHSLWKAALAPSSPPLLHVLSSSRLLPPLTFAAAPFCSAYSHCTDSFHQTLTWAYECDHMAQPPPNPTPPHCPPSPPGVPSIGCSSFTLAIQIIIFTWFEVIFNLKTVSILTYQSHSKCNYFFNAAPPALWHLCH